MARSGVFDRHSRQYEKWFSDNYCAYQSELEAVRHCLPACGVGLEVGVGSGRFAGPLGIQIGVEPSRRMRRLAERRGIVVHEAVAEELPFGDERFDFLLMVTTICFVDDLDKALREARRVLKSAGCIVLGFVDKDSPLGASYQQRKDKDVFYRHATFYSAAEVLALLRRNGFAEVEVVQTVFGLLSDIEAVQDFRKGYGQGGFVALRAVKAP